MIDGIPPSRVFHMGRCITQHFRPECELWPSTAWWNTRPNLGFQGKEQPDLFSFFIFCTGCTNYAALPFSLLDKHGYLALCWVIQLQQQHLTQALNFKHTINLIGTKWISADFSLNVLINPLLLSREFLQWRGLPGKEQCKFTSIHLQIWSTLVARAGFSFPPILSHFSLNYARSSNVSDLNVINQICSLITVSGFKYNKLFYH